MGRTLVAVEGKIRWQVSPSYLDRFPVTEIKIDRSFASGLERSFTKRTIVDFVIQIGTASGMNVVVEGIEDYKVTAILSYMGCPFGQGYAFGLPEGDDKLLARLARAAGG